MIQLKIRTEYDFGKTFAPMGRIVARLKELGCTHAGIVDSSTWGHVEFYTVCKAAGIEPILGVQCIVEDDDDKARKMWFLTKNEIGLSELYRYTSLSYRQPIKTPYGNKPRLYCHDVANMSGNIIKFAGNHTDEQFLVEIDAVIDYDPQSAVMNATKRKIAQKYGLREVSVSDNAYVYAEDRAIYETMSKAGVKMTPQHILDRLEHQDQAHDIAKACAGLTLPKAERLPDVDQFSAPNEMGQNVDTCEQVNAFCTTEERERFEYETKIINEKGFMPYFRIVADMVQFAKKHMLVGPSRGSAAGSFVSYKMGITEIDPLKAGLPFERFIDPTRTDLPDIDLDFPDAKRPLVFEYMREKYGSERVAHIGNVSRYKAKSSLNQVCKALRIPYAASNRVKYKISDKDTLDHVFRNMQEGREFIEQYPEAECARIIEGHASHSSVHAAGLLISDDEIENYATVDANGIAHVDKHAAEKLGLLKIDVLGLKTLTVIEDTGIKVDWYNLPLNDPKVFELYNTDQVLGLFQFEGPAVRSLSKEMKFETMNDLAAINALGRPGPMTAGLSQEYVKRRRGAKYDRLHPAVDKHLRETYGLPIYQEQTLAIAREVGKLDWGTCNKIRKAVSKTGGRAVFDTYWNSFLVGAKSNGLSEREAETIWNMLAEMGRWQMNKAHAWSYATLSYWMAYLRRYHPLEFTCASLNHAKDNESALMLLRDMVLQGIKYDVFDPAKSKVDWSIQNGVLVGGWKCLVGMGDAKALKLCSKPLTPEDMDKIAKLENPFADLFPMRDQCAQYYEKGIKTIAEIPDPPGTRQTIKFVARLDKIRERHENDEANVKKRGHKKQGGGPYLTLHMSDDTGKIYGQIAAWKMDRLAKGIEDAVDNVILVKALFFPDKRFAFVEDWKRA